MNLRDADRGESKPGSAPKPRAADRDKASSAPRARRKAADKTAPAAAGPLDESPATDERDKATAKDEEGYHDPPMTLWAHLDELRRRLVYSLLALFIGCIVAWYFRETLMTVLVEPFATAWRVEKIGEEVTLHFATPGAAFIAYLKLALLGGTALASPVIFYQIWQFVAPGLYGREKRYVIPFVLCSSALFVGGGYFGWRAAFPIAFRYLLGLSGTLGQQDISIVPTVMMGDYIDFVTRMLLAFGLMFEIPLVVFFLSVAGIINYLHLIHYGRWFVVVAFVVAAVFTPPDIASQLLMAIPMIVLYASSICLAWIFGPKPTQAQRDAYARRKQRKRERREQDRGDPSAS